MKWFPKEKIDKEKYLSEWHKVFAWFPVKTDIGLMVWLEFVDRRFTGKLTGHDGERIFEYKARKF